MSKLLPVHVCFVSLLLLAINGGAQTLINFESPPGGLVGVYFVEGTPVPPQSRITNQYRNLGVLMTNVALMDLGLGHATSGNNGIAGIDPDGNLDQGAAVYFTFVDPLDNESPAVTDYVGVSLDKWGASGNIITLWGFDINGNLLGSVSHPDTGGSVTLQGVGPIHTVVACATLIYHPAGGIGMDDLQFGPLTSLGRQASDSSRPISRVSSLPSSETGSNFQVQWSGTDTGSGVRDYAIYVSDNGGPFASWQIQTLAREAIFYGVGGHTYQFYSLARDWAGNGEYPKTAGETSTQVAGSATPPVSHVWPLPGIASSPNFPVQWSGSEIGSGIRDYTIYVSDNNTAFVPWLSQASGSQAWFAGRLGHAYAFFSIARDWAGNIENLKSRGEASTQVPAQMAGDTNGDGTINCLDLNIVKASIGKSVGQAGFDPRADVNHDGVVNVFDLAFVARLLIPRTTCP